MPHDKRDRVKPENPMTITRKLMKGLAPLRCTAFRQPIIDAIEAGKEKYGCRVVEFTIQNDHLHFTVEASGKEGLVKFIIGLSVRIAKTINRVLGRKGPVWRDRYHRRDMVSLREVYNGVRYVLCNGAKHGDCYEGKEVDPFSSAPWFRFWLGLETPRSSGRPVALPQTWKLRNCFEVYGKVDPKYFQDR